MADEEFVRQLASAVVDELIARNLLPDTLSNADGIRTPACKIEASSGGICGVKNAARFCGESTSAIRSAWRRGTLQGEKLGRNILFPRAHLEERRLAVALRQQALPDSAAHGHSRPLATTSVTSEPAPLSEQASAAASTE